MGNKWAKGQKGHDGSNAGRKPLPDAERKKYQLQFSVAQELYDAILAATKEMKMSKYQEFLRWYLRQQLINREDPATFYVWPDK